MELSMKKKYSSQFDKDIGKRVKSLRLLNKLTQEEMAYKLNIDSTSLYQNIEKGENNLSNNHLRKIKEEFGVSADFIIFGDVSSKYEYELFFESLSPDDKMQIFVNILAQLCGDDKEGYIRMISESINKKRDK